MNTSPRRFRRGDKASERPGLVFLRYGRGKEVWVSPQKLEAVRNDKKVIDKRFRDKPESKKAATLYMRDYQRKPERKAYHSAYYKSPQVRARYRQKYADDPEHFRQLQRTPKARISQRKSRQKRKAKIREWARGYFKRRRKTILGRIEHNCRQTVRRALKMRGVTKSITTCEALGCTYKFFQDWIERQFSPGMTWENRGLVWECDHVIPIARFDLADMAQLKLAFGYENCRPLWKEDNRTKNDFIEHNGETVRARELRKIIPFSIAA